MAKSASSTLMRGNVSTSYAWYCACWSGPVGLRSTRTVTVAIREPACSYWRRRRTKDEGRMRLWSTAVHSPFVFRRSSSFDHLGRRVGDLAEALEDQLGQVLVDLAQRLVDLGGVRRGVAVAVGVALDEQRAEVLHLQQPHRLGDAELLLPEDVAHADDFLTVDGADAVGHRGEADDAVLPKHVPVHVRGHAALVDHRAHAVAREQRLHPLRVAEAGGRLERVDDEPAGRDLRPGRRRLGRDVELLADVDRGCVPPAEHVVVHAVAGREDAARQVDDVADAELANVVLAERDGEVPLADRVGRGSGAGGWGLGMRLPLSLGQGWGEGL